MKSTTVDHVLSAALRVLMLGLLFCSCINRDDSAQSETLFRLLPAEASGIHFNNRIQENDTFNMISFSYIYNGGGVGIGDVNNDGLQDIFFTGNMVSNRLYLNKGNLTFEDVTESAGLLSKGWSTGVTLTDINQDGYLDIYVCRSGNYSASERSNLLYINNQDLTFSQQAEAYGLADTSYSTQAAFFDYDKDGDLDMYLLNSTNVDRNPNRIRPIINDGGGPARDLLYRNEGTGSSAHPVFRDVSKQAGIVHNGWGLGIAVSDLNRDGWEDLYISNDFLAHDYLYINERDGAFSEHGTAYLRHHSHFGMGNDLADFNNDGLVDIMVLDMLPPDNFHRKKMAGPVNHEQFQMMLKAGYHPQFMRNTLQLNRGLAPDSTLAFSEIAQLSGVASTDWSWAPLWADLDNDGYKDLLVTNGYRRDITDMDFIVYNAQLGGSRQEVDRKIVEKSRQLPSIESRNAVYRNGHKLLFEDVAEQWGFSQASFSNGASYADLDNDGDLDLVISNIDQPAFLYENTANSKLNQNKSISIQLKGKTPNHMGIGTQIALYHHGQQQFYHHALSRGFQSSTGHAIHFGLGSAVQADSLRVQWPDGRIQMLRNIPAGESITLRQEEAVTTTGPQSEVKTLLREVSADIGLDYLHQEKTYNDFAAQPLLPHSLSQQGPKLSTADVNGDGLQDIFIGGNTENPGTLFYQTSEGSFEQSALEQTATTVDGGSLFLDADMDGDQDLYIVSGGNQFPLESARYQDRLYMNQGKDRQGKSRFVAAPEALPPMPHSGSCVVAADYDGDGDMDLFVGGRLLPGFYPLPGVSYLLRNDGGIFSNVTEKVAPALQHVGMVTDALWTDFDHDGLTDLIVVGEFMPVTFYQNQGGTFRDVSSQTGLSHTQGLWNCIEGADFDGDGDTDYVLGNLGRNSRYQPTPEEPLSIYASDYDKNGSIDAIMSYFLEGKEYPVHSRDDLIRQLNAAKRRFPAYADYAKATIHDLISPAEMEEAYIVRAYRTESSYMSNQGAGKFNLSPLPLQAQFSPLQALVCSDMDQDQKLDILAVGNAYDTEVSAGQYDAGMGCLLKSDGSGNFEALDLQSSGFYTPGDNRDIIISKAGEGENLYIVSTNQDSIKVFEKNY